MGGGLKGKFGEKLLVQRGTRLQRVALVFASLIWTDKRISRTFKKIYIADRFKYFKNILINFFKKLETRS